VLGQIGETNGKGRKPIKGGERQKMAEENRIPVSWKDIRNALKYQTKRDRKPALLPGRTDPSEGRERKLI